MDYWTTKNESCETVESEDSAMKVRIELFAVFRDAAGQGHVTLDFDHPPNVANLKSRLQSMWPDHAELLCKSRIAVNNQFQDDQHTIGQGDETALIPPVSGG